jgi:signal transduction histidine kinase/ligand-binding sensor domain-containing protein
MALNARRLRSATWALAAAVLLAAAPRATAQDPGLDVSQYAHTSWKIREGFVRGEIMAIAQTPDGYLWLGTEFGLLRFDGVKAVPWQAPGDQQLPSTVIRSLLAARDGTLWIGTFKGLASWKDGRITSYPELAGEAVGAILEDLDGTVWAGGQATPPPGKLCAIQNGTATCYGADGALGAGVSDLYEDRKGNIWVGVFPGGLWRWKPGPAKFYALPGEIDGIQALSEDSDGTLLVGCKGGVHRFLDGNLEPYAADAGQFHARKVFRDRNGGVWLGTRTRGLLHVHQGRQDAFTTLDGLSGDDILNLFEDREGSIWAATISGLDRFRDFPVHTISRKQGLSGDAAAVLADLDGSVWLSTMGGLDRWRNGETFPYDKRTGKLNGLAPNSLFQDSRGRLWISTNRGFGYLESDRFVAIGGIPSGPVHGIAEDSAGGLWISNQESGLIHLAGGKVVEQIPWAALGHNDPGTGLVADLSHGGLWLGFYRGGVSYFSEGKVRASYSTANGLGAGRVNSLRLDRDGTLWAATDGGLSRLKNGHIATLSAKNGLPCDAVHWLMQDQDGSYWLYTPCGLARIARPEMEAWTTAADRGNEPRKIQATVFDSSDGVRSMVTASGYVPLVSRAVDGKLWFGTEDGASFVDPRHLPFNNVVPPVRVERITADRAVHDVSSAGSERLQLPPLVRDLAIDYTAMSLVAPEKVHFRYRLVGQDRDWREVVNERQVQYSNLPPGKYRFQVTACNNSGVWNEAGTFVDFSIAPAYYQTMWFRALCVAGFLVLLWGIYRMRLHQLRRQYEIGMEERVRERTRIARELHDTLLQSFQGLMFQYQAARNMLPRHPDNAGQALDAAIQETEHAIAEGRDAIRDLRPRLADQGELPGMLTAAGEELGGGENEHAPVFRVVVEGAPRKLSPVVQDEVYRIVREVIRNAYRHAHARSIEVEVHYDQHALRVRVRDDGTGIEQKILDGGAREGHWGLTGARERAQKIGARLDLWSQPGTGTEAEIGVPAAVAYQKRRDGRRFSFFGKDGSGEQRS